MTVPDADQHGLLSAGPGPAVPDAREAALRPFRRPGRGYWLLLAALTALVVLGVAAWSVQLHRGLGAAGYNDHAFWAIYIADVVTFIGVSYGGAVISAILRLTGAGWRAPPGRLGGGTAGGTGLVGGRVLLPSPFNLLPAPRPKRDLHSLFSS